MMVPSGALWCAAMAHPVRQVAALQGRVPLAPLARAFHATAPLCHRWEAAEDANIRALYAKYGPAWTVVALRVPGRSPVECRRRHLVLEGALAGLPEGHKRLIYEENYEVRPDGSLIRVPMERIEASPFARVASSIAPVRFRRDRTRAPWSAHEMMAIREGFEQYGPRWDLIAKPLQYRTERQVRNVIVRRYIDWYGGRLPA